MTASTNLNIRIPPEELEAFRSSLGSRDTLSSRLRYLMKRDIAERARKRSPKPLTTPAVAETIIAGESYNGVTTPAIEGLVQAAIFREAIGPEKAGDE